MLTIPYMIYRLFPSDNSCGFIFYLLEQAVRKLPVAVAVSQIYHYPGTKKSQNLFSCVNLLPTPVWTIAIKDRSSNSRINSVFRSHSNPTPELRPHFTVLFFVGRFFNFRLGFQLKKSVGEARRVRKYVKSAKRSFASK